MLELPFNYPNIPIIPSYLLANMHLLCIKGETLCQWPFPSNLRKFICTETSYGLHMPVIYTWIYPYPFYLLGPKMSESCNDGS